MYYTCAQQVADLMTYAMPLCACGKKRKLYILFMIFNRRHSMHFRTIAGYWSKHFILDWATWALKLNAMFVYIEVIII